MAKEIVLEAEKRVLGTKGDIHTMRRNGRVPAVAYGGAKEAALSVSLDAKRLTALIYNEHGRNALITLKVDGASHPVLIKELQRNAITRQIIHVDLHRISLKDKIEVLVPIHIKGEAPGVKLGGGILEHIIREVRVKCLPTAIPESIDVDVSNLQINQAIKAKDLKVPANAEIFHMDPENVVINIVAPTELEEVVAPEAVAAAAGTAEPEVIKKGKLEEGEEGAAAAGTAKPGAGAAKPAAGAKPTAGAAPAKPEAKK